MGPQDGVDYALRALADLRDELGRDDWHAVFVGGGDTFDDDGRAVAASSGSTTASSSPGAIPDEDVLRYLSTRRRVPGARTRSTRSTTSPR